MKSKSSFYGAAANVASAPVFGIAFLLHFPANWWRQFRAYVGRLPKHSSKLSSVEWLAVFFIASLATLVQSHVIVKLSFLGLFLYFFAYQVMQRRLAIRLQPKLFWFYSWYIAVAIIWAIVGLLYPGNYNQGVLEAVQLYVVWSLAFIVLYMTLRSMPALRIFHQAIVLAGILIPLINFLAVADVFFSWGLVSESLQQEMDMFIGFGDGYIQITSQNIDLMFLITAYLIVIALRKDAGAYNNWPTKLALVFSIVLDVISGRRALWLVLAFVPAVIIIMAKITRSSKLLNTSGRRLLYVWSLAGLIGFGSIWIIPDSALEDFGGLSRLKAGMSDPGDLRIVQRPYLLEGYADRPIFGSGFGGTTPHFLREFERPWAGYELTYFQMLFNLGTAGMTLLGILFVVYLAGVIKIIRKFREGSLVPFALVVGYISLLMGAYTNRYFGSFDLLFFVGILPLLSTFPKGFSNQANSEPTQLA